MPVYRRQLIETDRAKYLRDVRSRAQDGGVRGI